MFQKILLYFFLSMLLFTCSCASNWIRSGSVSSADICKHSLHISKDLKTTLTTEKFKFLKYNIQSRLLILDKIDNNTTDLMKCFLVEEYFKIRKERGEYIFLFYYKETNSVFLYIFNFEQDTFLESIFVPINDFIVSEIHTVKYSLRNLMRMESCMLMEAPCNRKLVVVDLDMGTENILIWDFYEFLDNITNGNFSKNVNEAVKKQ